MDIKDIRAKSEAELKSELKNLREKLRELRFKMNFQEAKNVKEAGKVRKTIARILTTINEKAKN